MINFYYLILFCLVILFNFNFQGKLLGKKIKELRFPAKKLKKQSFASKSNIKINYLHNLRHYNQEYLLEYEKMIYSLLSLTESRSHDHNISKTIFLPNNSELKTVNSLYNEKTNNLPICKGTKEKDWRAVKVFQVEDTNSVYLKENQISRVRVVEKKMNLRKHYDKEINFFRHCHQNLSKYLPDFVCHSIKKAKGSRRKNEYKIVTGFVDGEKSHIMAARASYDQTRLMVAQLFNALIQLHKTGFMHCDLSPANVMVTSDFRVKLIDFGMATRVGQANGYRGSTYTRAPELHKMVPGKIDVGIDWWAFGCTISIWYYYHYNPHDAISEPSTSSDSTEPIYLFTPMKLRKSKNYFFAMTFPPQLSSTLRNFLSIFLVINPELRTFSTERLQNIVRQHEFFEGLDWSKA